MGRCLVKKRKVAMTANGIALRWQGIKARYIGKLDTVD